MSQSEMINGFLDITPLKIIRYTVSSFAPPEFYIDRIAALSLARKVDGMSPRPIAVQFLYTQFDEIVRQMENFVWTEQTRLDRVSNLLQPTKTISGKQLYHISSAALLKSVEKDVFTWETVYHPAELYDEACQAVEEIRQESIAALQSLLSQYDMSESNSIPFNSFTLTSHFPDPTLNTLTVPAFSVTPASIPMLSATPITVPTPLPSILPQTPQAANTNMQFALRQMTVTSGFPSPVSEVEVAPVIREPVNTSVDEIIASLSRPQQESRRQSMQMPISQFTLAKNELKEDEKAAQKIVNLFKLLAINTTPGAVHRVSIKQEIKAIRSMSVGTNLNIGTQERKLPETIKIIFSRYDKNDEQGNESFQRALLMVAIRLMRQKFANETGKKGPGNYVADFDRLYPFSSRFIPHGAHLCRIIVSCGHPCILIILVRLAIRNRMCLGKLLDEIPLQHFCRFIATGKVTDYNPQTEKITIHDNLLWLHKNVVLPLLREASQRIHQRLYLLDGSLDCDEDTCLRAIVHHTLQVKYGNFLAGHNEEPDWKRGRVLLENRSFDKESKAEYSIEKVKRTFHQYPIANCIKVEYFQDPPESLYSQIIPMQSG